MKKLLSNRKLSRFLGRLGLAAEPGPVPASERPRLLDYGWTGLGGGMLAGLLLGVVEAGVIVAQARPPRDLTVLGWGAAVSGLLWSFVGLGAGLGIGVAARLLGRRRAAPERRYAFVSALLFAGFGFVVSWFRISRDVFRESIGPTSPAGALTLAGLAVAFGAVFFLMRYGVRRLASLPGGRVLVRPWGTPAAASLAAALLVVVGALGAEESAHANGAGRAPNAAAPNVVLVMVDTVRADRVGLYGYEDETAPNLRALAADGVVFENAFAQSSWTRPSVATILTGRYASSHRAIAKPDALPDEVDTIAEVLRARGYRTGGIVTNFNLARYFNFQQGFDTYEFLEPERLLGADDSSAKLVVYELLRRVAARLPRPLRPEQFYREASYTTDRAIEWLRGVGPDGPYFLFLNYMDPHDPYFPHPLDGTGVGRAFMPNPDPADAERIGRLYDGEIRYWDEHLGRLIETLRSRPDWDRTLVIVCSDHGEEFNDHGGWYHGTTLYEEQIRVPLVVRLPGDELAGTREPRWVGLVDIAQTVARLAGAAAPAGAQGEDLFAAEGGARVLFAEEDHEGNRLRSVRYEADGREWKLVEANPSNPRRLEPTELYELRSDPAEQRDRERDEPAALGEARRRLEEAAARAAQGAVETSSVGLDGAAVERLRSLGYMQ